jgi:hypothetical protein
MHRDRTAGCLWRYDRDGRSPGVRRGLAVVALRDIGLEPEAASDEAPVATDPSRDDRHGIRPRGTPVPKHEHGGDIDVRDP